MISTATPAAAATWIAARSDIRPVLGIVLGSAFSGLADLVRPAAALDFREIPGFTPTAVPGHPGRLVLGGLETVPVAILAGRHHYYEGHDLATVTFPMRVLAALGATAVLLTNAAGGIREDLAPGDFAMIADHVNLMFANPLRGAGCPPAFVDLSEVYSARLRGMMREAAEAEGIPLKEGVYGGVGGPSYETPAEIRAFGRLGIDMVGMSTVPEAIVACHEGLEVAGLSCISNRAAGLGGRIDHGEVLAVGRRVTPDAMRLIRRFAAIYGNTPRQRMP